MKQKLKSLSSESHSVSPEEGSQFTGVARSIECYNNQGFKNFRIVTVFIENGRVVKQEYSDPHAHFEVVARLELMNDISIMKLNNTWVSGKALTQ